MPAYTPADIHRLFRDAFNLGDLDALVELYEPSAVFVTGGEQVTGRDQISGRRLRALSPVVVG